MSRSISAAEGFSLIEVMIASAILGFAFVAVVGVMSQSLGNIGRMETQQQALLHGREEMTELLLQQPLVPGHFAGRWQDGYRWEADIAPDPSEQDAAFSKYGLFLVRLHIFWRDENHLKSYVLETTQWARRLTPSTNP